MRMKKTIVLFIAFLVAGISCSCQAKDEPTNRINNEPEINVSGLMDDAKGDSSMESTSLDPSFTSSDAENLLQTILGTEYSFSYADTVAIEGTDYYVFVWRQIEEDYSILVNEVFVQTDGTSIYTGDYVSFIIDGNPNLNLIWSK